MASSFLTALATAKSSDGVKLPAGPYDVEIVAASVSVSVKIDPETGLKVARKMLKLDLTTIGGEFAGRKQVKNQPLTAAAASFVTSLLEQTGLTEFKTNIALGESFERGDKAAMLMFVGKRFKVARSYSTTGNTEVNILAA